ncbi:hypothetical protein CONLIGDRAFT_163689 [Coniochaeta ligniaria NRRL 30616]|uniref:Uncharacterized protein n=1 Tax=Coniochaeta ligniaria NRRL 30616 TaxID=1408157 RepID=A0A1J7J121_9PEZI|nr:hypothetical protein CONLIGDRAFT_163689 [Coniochaeta ligniaria NRRL 30616]
MRVAYTWHWFLARRPRRCLCIQPMCSYLLSAMSQLVALHARRDSLVFRGLAQRELREALVFISVRSVCRLTTNVATPVMDTVSSMVSRA